MFARLRLPFVQSTLLYRPKFPFLVPKVFKHQQTATSNIMNQQIRADRIILIDEQGKRLGERKLVDVLRSLNRQTHALVQVTSAATNSSEANALSRSTPVCKIFTREDLREHRRRQEEQEKQERRQNREKEIRFNETISEHDLITKMRHMRELLMKGYHLKILQVGKRRPFSNRSGDPLKAPEIDRQMMELIREHLCKSPKNSINDTNKKDGDLDFGCGARVQVPIKVMPDGVSLSMALAPPTTANAASIKKE